MSKFSLDERMRLVSVLDDNRLTKANLAHLILDLVEDKFTLEDHKWEESNYTLTDQLIRDYERRFKDL
jgi:hypothetical protein